MIPRPASLDFAAAAKARTGGSVLTVVELAGPVREPPSRAGVILLGVHRRGLRPSGDLSAFDILLSIDEDAPAPWVGAPAGMLDAMVAELETAAAANPVAAQALAQVLRVTLGLSFTDALSMESMAYSMLLGGAEFRAWRAATPVRARSASDAPRLKLSRKGEALHIVLARPQARNAVDARMRDDLVEALKFAALDPGAPPVVLSGEGPSFCAGGDLDEFGSATDPAAAHAIRMRRSPVRLVHEMRRRVTARLHGACIGAGIEIPAAAGRATASPDAWFRLPEVSMGLIPGAGGTASIPRRIGRARTCFLALSGRPLDAETALDWGLIDSVEGA